MNVKVSSYGSSCFLALFSPQLAYLLSQFQCFVCPVGFNSETNGFTVECEPSDIFVMQEYTLPAVLQNIQRWVRQFKHWLLIVFRLNVSQHFCLSGWCS